MPAHISASVGAAARNSRGDVIIVQQLLGHHGISPGRVDGQCGPLTVHAIIRFQTTFMPRPDGRVDPNGVTLRHLNANGAATRPAAPRPHAPSPAAPHATPHATPPNINTALTTTVPRPDRSTLNRGLTAVSPRFMLDTLGSPRETFTADCQPMTNAALRRHVSSESVGPFNVTGLRPAVASIRTAFAQVSRDQPAVYAALGTAGMLCCRLIRGSATGISNHSWGTAIDLKLNGVLDRRGDSRVQTGLTLIAPIMNAHGWYWGAAFNTEDAMHFEASRALITQWAPTLR